MAQPGVLSQKIILNQKPFIMKKIILHLGTLCFLLMANPLQAQIKKTYEKQQKSKVTPKVSARPMLKLNKVIGSTLPTIISPANNEQVASPLIINGTASENIQIEVTVEAVFTGGSQDLGTFKTNADSAGEWSTIPINLWVPEDAKNVKFHISVLQNLDNNSSEGERITVIPKQKVQTVARAQINGDMVMQLNPSVSQKQLNQKATLKPRFNAADIKLPPPPSINSPSNQTVITTPLVIEGTAQKNTTIDLNIESNIALPNFNIKSVRTKADENGNWKTDPIHLWLFEGETDARFKIKVTEIDTKTHVRRQSQPITVIPSIDQSFPRRPVKPWGISHSPKSGTDAVSPVVIRGSAGPNRTVQIFMTSRYTDAEGKRVDLPHTRTATTSDNNGKWSTNPIVLPTPLTEKQLTHNVQVSQIGLGHQSGNFSFKMTSDPNRVVPPVMTNPNSSHSIGRTQVVKGTGVPGRFVEVTVTRSWEPKKRTNPPKFRNKEIGKHIVKVDADGNWKTPAMSMGNDKDKDLIYGFTAEQIFRKYDQKKNDGTYPEVRSKSTGIRLRQAVSF